MSKLFSTKSLWISIVRASPIPYSKCPHGGWNPGREIVSNCSQFNICCLKCLVYFKLNICPLILSTLLTDVGPGSGRICRRFIRIWGSSAAELNPQKYNDKELPSIYCLNVATQNFIVFLWRPLPWSCYSYGDLGNHRHGYSKVFFFT